MVYTNDTIIYTLYVCIYTFRYQPVLRFIELHVMHYICEYTISMNTFRNLTISDSGISKNITCNMSKRVAENGL